MRRLDTVTKEMMMWSREQIYYIKEKQEHFSSLSERGIDPVHYNDMIDIIEDALIDVMELELGVLVDEYDFDPDEGGTAFPHMPEIESFQDDTASGYCEELRHDLVELFDIPAIEVVDQFELWLSELVDFYENRS